MKKNYIDIQRSNDALGLLSEYFVLRPYLALSTFDNKLNNKHYHLFKNRNEFRQKYPSKRWLHTPVIEMSDGSIQQVDCNPKKWDGSFFLMDKHSMELINKVGVSISKTKEWQQIYQDLAKTFIKEYNSLVHNNVFNVDINIKGSKTSFQNMIVDTSEDLYNEINRRTVYLCDEYDVLMEKVRRTPIEEYK